MVETRRPAPERRPRRLDTLLLEEALATWLPPAVGLVALAGAVTLDALGVIGDAAAAFTSVTALLLLGAFSVVRPRLESGGRGKMHPALLAIVASVWVGLYAAPFALRLFPGEPVAVAPVDVGNAGERLAVGRGRFDVVLDAELPRAANHQTRQLHYAFTLTDGAGTPHDLAGDLGDRWQTRRLGRRGTAPVHLEHLSARYEIDNPTDGPLRLTEVTLAGVPSATLRATVYRHRVPPVTWLLLGGAVLVLVALAFDFRWGDRRSPVAAVLTATATGAVIVFCSSAAGHAGLRQIFGAVIVGALVGIPAATFMAWFARRASWTRTITVRDHA